MRLLIIAVLLVLPLFGQYQDIFSDDANTLAHWEFNESYAEESARMTTLVAGSWSPTYVELEAGKGVYGLQSSNDGTKYLYIASGDDANLALASPGTYTLEFVLKIDETIDQLIFEHSNGSGANGWALNLWNAANQYKIRFGAYDAADGDNTNAIASAGPVINTLYYICVYYDTADSLTLWINNVKQVSGDLTGIASISVTAQANIGQWDFLSTFPMKAKIYGIRISNTLRTPAERIATWAWLQDIPDLPSGDTKPGFAGFKRSKGWKTY